ncbi:MAG TPA: NAD(P)(+) transhydrogenase (Re/Si-specific) subunit beta [Longimicrobiales bacterium]|nr:NAD(P)(+) transhydrogenase (Re/Si-specific) subunit beta [Longimicrobiales bacterium]
MELLTLVEIAYLLSAILFVTGLKRMQSPATARQGNGLAALAMLVAIVATLVHPEYQILSWTGILIGIVIGSLAGAVAARTVKMTAMPEMVGIFNGFGGGASALVAAAEFARIQQTPGASIGLEAGITIGIGMLIGAVTFSGSFVAFGKLSGRITGNPVTFPLQKTFNALLFASLLVIGGILATGGTLGSLPPLTLFWVFTGLALLLGILLVIPIGGADMPVVISLLNSYSGLAASAAGFVIGNNVLILSGALVGAAGLFLTMLMCKAMNRSLANVAFGAFGGESSGTKAVGGGDKPVRSVDPDGAATMLAYASSVIVVPGYGLAVAQAQHDLKKVMDILGERGVDVKYAIHPVAGRMPGHMNVLLAEADVPYDLLFDLDEINDDFSRTDVVLVVGANDVVNPDARDPKSVIAGMPILDVDKARNVIVMKRSLSPGFAGIDNPLFYMDHNYMFFGDAKKSMQELAKAVREV